VENGASLEGRARWDGCSASKYERDLVVAKEYHMIDLIATLDLTMSGYSDIISSRKSRLFTDGLSTNWSEKNAKSLVRNSVRCGHDRT